MSDLSLLESRVAAVRSRMEKACAEAGRDPSSVLLCAASKTQTSETVAQAVLLDIDLFGENRVQELVEKNSVGAYAPKPLHFIGHLQTNKVRQVVGTASLIHSVDSEKLIRAIDKEARRQNLVQDILLEVNIGGEESKSGTAPEDLPRLAEFCSELEGIHLLGLMCVPPRTDDIQVQHNNFARMRSLFDDLAARKLPRVDMCHLSMGMSSDFEAAISEGATIIRVGTAIFGPRNYKIA